MKTSLLKSACVALCTAGALAACSPKFDWRDFRSTEAPYAVMFPAKPATQTRPVKLGEQEVKLSMAAAEVDGAMFAVGTAELPDAGQAALAVQALKTAMVQNIHGQVTKEGTQNGAFVVEARGSLPNGKQMLMHGRFLSKDKRVYEVIIVGPEKQFNQDTVDTFMSSFKLY